MSDTDMAPEQVQQEFEELISGMKAKLPVMPGIGDISISPFSPPWDELLEELSHPFDPRDVQWKPGATTPRDNPTRAMALAYADPRVYIDRLHEVCGGHWSDDYHTQITANDIFVTCRLTIHGVTRCDVGESPLKDRNAFTVAVAQAFKRACVKFGLGAYFYSWDKIWVDFSNGYFTKDAQAELESIACRLTEDVKPTAITTPENFLALAAKMSTKAKGGTRLGDCTVDMLQQLLDSGAIKKTSEFYKGVKALRDYLIDQEAKSDATYNKLQK